MVREVCLSDCIKTRDCSHEVVVNPDTTHCIVDSGVDHHRLLVRVGIGNLLIHLEEVTITLADFILTKSFNSSLEVKEYCESCLIHTKTSVTTLFCGT